MDKDNLNYDILKEMFNIGVGKAAGMLSEIINKKILLDVPNIEVLNLENSNSEIEKGFSKTLKGTLMISSITFEEKITGQANLIFPAEKMRKFINLCISQKNESIEKDMSFTDIDFDIIKEIGNIILNSIIGEMGNFLDVTLDYTLPKVKLFNNTDFKNNIKNNIKNKKEACMLMLYITFIIDDIEIEGAIIIDLTLNSLNNLMKIIEKMEDDLNG
ncbi:chemotaxis protein CheC [Clostridium cochlearium]|uniref:Chemotaxis protein CheC n=1 Tax=Clostridium cochlearium TaxID=1494 RepID=A0ABY0QIM9_CLOCO|nr:chemotaxis protein CheC [Clostridium cochlearium]NME95817.1 chemotaxis protein CheC [Clostridium cochlearium]SDK89098.1 chemotaxis protein CheC [Clostridium cochlearium]